MGRGAGFTRRCRDKGIPLTRGSKINTPLNPLLLEGKFKRATLLISREVQEDAHS